MDKSKFTLEERVKLLEMEVEVLQEKIKELTECETVNVEEKVVGQIDVEPQTVDVAVPEPVIPEPVVETPIENPVSEPVMETIEIALENEKEHSDAFDAPVVKSDFEGKTKEKTTEDNEHSRLNIDILQSCALRQTHRATTYSWCKNHLDVCSLFCPLWCWSLENVKARVTL